MQKHDKCSWINIDSAPKNIMDIYARERNMSNDENEAS